MNPAFTTVSDIQAVAKLFSELADAYNTRLRGAAPKMTSNKVYARLQEEQRLRSISNQLYFEANNKIIASGIDDQTAIETSLKTAITKLKSFTKFAKVLDLLGDVIVFGGAILAGKPLPIIAALNEIRQDIA